LTREEYEVFFGCGHEVTVWSWCGRIHTTLHWRRTLPDGTAAGVRTMRLAPAEPLRRIREAG